MPDPIGPQTVVADGATGPYLWADGDYDPTVYRVTRYVLDDCVDCCEPINTTNCCNFVPADPAVPPQLYLHFYGDPASPCLDDTTWPMTFAPGTGGTGAVPTWSTGEIGNSCGSAPNFLSLRCEFYTTGEFVMNSPTGGPASCFATVPGGQVYPIRVVTCSPLVLAASVPLAGDPCGSGTILVRIDTNATFAPPPPPPPPVPDHFYWCGYDPAVEHRTCTEGPGDASPPAGILSPDGPFVGDPACGACDTSGPYWCVVYREYDAAGRPVDDPYSGGCVQENGANLGDTRTEGSPLTYAPRSTYRVRTVTDGPFDAGGCGGNCPPGCGATTSKIGDNDLCLCEPQWVCVQYWDVDETGADAPGGPYPGGCLRVADDFIGSSGGSSGGSDPMAASGLPGAKPGWTRRRATGPGGGPWPTRRYCDAVCPTSSNPTEVLPPGTLPPHPVPCDPKILHQWDWSRSAGSDGCFAGSSGGSSGGSGGSTMAAGPRPWGGPRSPDGRLWVQIV